jgi:hypothetical protein
MADKQGIFSLITWFGADTTDFIRKTDAAKARMRLFEATLGRIKTAIAVAFATNSLKNFISTTTKAYNVQIQAESGLLNALGGRVDMQERLLRQAAVIQGKTKIGDEVIIAQQKYLAALKLTEVENRKLIDAAIELSAATGTTLEFAVRNLAKTYGGLTGELGELLPGLKELTKEDLKSGKAIDYVNENFKGFAETARNVGDGEVVSLTNQIGDLAEVIGGKLQPILNSAAKSLSNFTNKLTYNAKTSGKNAGIDSIIELQDKIHGLSKDEAWDILIMELGRYQKLLSDAAQEQKKYQDKFSNDKLLNFLGSTFDLTGSYKKNKTELLALTEQTEEYKYVIEQLNKLLKDQSELVNFLAEEEPPIPDAIKINDYRKNKIMNPEEPYIPDIDYPKLREVYLNIESMYSEALDKATEFYDRINKLNSQLESSVEGMIVSIADSFGRWSASTMNHKEFFNSILSSFGGFVQQMGALIISYGITMSAFKKAFTNPAAAIAAGIALVAIGSAVSSLAAKGPSSSSSYSSGGIGYATANVPGGGGAEYKNQNLPQLAALGENLYWVYKRVDDRIGKGR